MKKVLATLLAAGVVLSSAAFAPAKTAKAEAQKIIGVSMPTQSLQRWNQDGTNIKTQLQKKGYKVILQYANNEVNTQTQQIENMVTKGAKVLLISAIDGKSLTSVLKEAHSAGVKVIAYDRLIMNTPYVDYYDSYDNYGVGVIQGKFLESKLKLKTTKGPYNIELFAGDPGDNNARFFFNGAMSIIKPYIQKGKLVVKSKQTAYSAIAIANWTSGTAQTRMDNLITANYASGAKLSAVLSPNDSLAIGIVASLKSNGYGTAAKPYPFLTGQDCDIANVKAIIKGQQSMSVFKNTKTEALEAVTMVNDLLKGKKAPVNNTTDYKNGKKTVPSMLLTPVLVNKSNWKKILVTDSHYYKLSQLQ